MLIAILLPALGAARNAAYAVQCLSNERQIGLAMAAYTTENKDYLIPYRVDKGIGTSYDEIFWPARLMREGYLPTGAVYRCATLASQQPDFDRIDSSWPVVAASNALAWSHYGYNWAWLGSYNRVAPRPADWSARTRQTSEVRSPSSTVLMVDSVRFDFIGSPLGMRGYARADDFYPTNYRGHARHNMAVNTLWVDGHASAVPVSGNEYEIWEALPGRASTNNMWSPD